MPDIAAAPVERTSFFAEQARRRRRARLWALLCLGLAAGIGAVLSTITGPLVLLLLAVALKLLAWLGLAPAIMLAALHALDLWIGGCVAAFSQGLDILDAQGPAGALAAARRFLHAAQLVLPGMLFAALVWARLARFHRRSAIAAAAADLAARAPCEADPEERQLGNILAELALAAGLPTPRLLLVDAPEPNAASFGASHQDAGSSPRAACSTGWSGGRRRGWSRISSAPSAAATCGWRPRCRRCSARWAPWCWSSTCPSAAAPGWRSATSAARCSACCRRRRRSG